MGACTSSVKLDGILDGRYMPPYYQRGTIPFVYKDLIILIIWFLDYNIPYNWKYQFYEKQGRSMPLTMCLSLITNDVYFSFVVLID